MTAEFTRGISRLAAVLPRLYLALFLLLGCVTAGAGPIQGSFFQFGDDGSLNLIIDGTSNTILLTESSALQTCFRGVRRAEIQDGTSNTIFIGESETTDVCLDNLLTVDDWQQALTDIIDGTSNTLLIGEGELIAVDGSSRVDVCISNASRIVDGVSNTIAFGESSCFGDLQLVQRASGTPVPLPSGLALLLLGFGLLLKPSRATGYVLRQ